MLEKFVREAEGAIRLGKLNTDQNADLAQELKITSLPTVIKKAKERERKKKDMFMFVCFF